MQAWVTEHVLQAGFVYDCLFVVLVLFVAGAGMRRGFISGLLGLGGTIAGVFCGSQAARSWAPTLYERYLGVAIGERITETVADYGADLTAALEQLSFLPAALRRSLETILLSGSDDIVPRLVEALQPVLLPLVEALVFLAVCTVVRLAVRLLALLLRRVNALPLVGDLNKVLGFALGFVTGILDCWLLSMGLWLLCGFTDGGVPFLTAEALAGSAIYRFFAAFNIFAV